MCILLCVVKLNLREKLLEHSSHLNGFSEKFCGFFWLNNSVSIGGVASGTVSGRSSGSAKINYDKILKLQLINNYMGTFPIRNTVVKFKNI